MKGLKSEFSLNQTILLLMKNLEYNSVMVDTMKELKGASICYVTTNKTFDAVKEIFKKKKIKMDNIVFVDAISKTIKKVPDSSDNVYYVDSPGALTELSLVIGKFLKHEFDYLIFDSLTNLTVYNKASVCVKFLTSLNNKIKKTKTKALFYAIGSEEGEIVKQSNMFADKVIKNK